MDDYFNDYVDEKMYGRTASKEADKLKDLSYIRSDHYRNSKSKAYNQIKRIVAASVGKEWNEITQKVFHSVKSLERGYVQTSLERIVEINTTLDSEGQVCYFETHPWRRWNTNASNLVGLYPIENSMSKWYVHPTTFILTPVVNPKVPKAFEEPTIFYTGDYEDICKIKGIWYYRFVNKDEHSTLQRWSVGVPFKKLGDRYHQLPVPREGKYRNYISEYSLTLNPTFKKIVIQKRQLSSKELKNLNLKNDNSSK